MEMRSETSSEEEKEAREKFWIKEEPMAVTTSELTPQISQNTYKDDGAGTGKEESKSSKDDPTPSKDTAEKGCGKKRPSSLSTSSPDKHPDQREKSCKRQRLLSKEDESCEEAQKILSRIKTETSADDGESCSSSQQTGFDKGAGALVKDSGDQSDAVYLGESRALIIPEKDLSSHVSQFNHQKLHPVVIELDSDEYDKLAALPDNKAIQRMNWLLKQRDLELHLPAAKSPKQKAVLSSPHDASSPNHVTQQEDFAASVEAEVQVTTPDTLELVAKTHHETPGNRLWQESQVPGLKDTQKKSPSVFSAPPAASVNTEQQNRFEPGQTAELLPDSGCRPVPGHHGASQEDPMISRVSDPERLDAGPTDSESTHTFIHAAEKDQETPEIMQQPESLETDLKDTPLKLEHSLRMFPSECVVRQKNMH
ncbi:uncharacterized protein ACBR49_016904 [Aulostomus maculatus]